TKCWRGLSAVFKPGQRPWIQPEGAGTEAIVAQVKQCPSGALTYRMNSEEKPVPVEQGEVQVNVSANGPLLLKGRVQITHSDGRIESLDGATALCRCGASAKKPYCDGSHRRVGFIDKG
ncbi:MAG TPA: CDGSH iron-sulfur domain-containing protein, partial [Flavobacteriales bacterium]|nr:CDGSH iron-sulfur domain-containing protein [Flavobacteriales bacterium]